MQRTCMDVRNDFTEADHNLLEIEHQIIDYINQIEIQRDLYKGLVNDDKNKKNVYHYLLASIYTTTDQKQEAIKEWDNLEDTNRKGSSS